MTAEVEPTDSQTTLSSDGQRDPQRSDIAMTVIESTRRHRQFRGVTSVAVQRVTTVAARRSTRLVARIEGLPPSTLTLAELALTSCPDRQTQCRCSLRGLPYARPRRRTRHPTLTRTLPQQLGFVDRVDVTAHAGLWWPHGRTMPTGFGPAATGRPRGRTAAERTHI